MNYTYPTLKSLHLSNIITSSLSVRVCMQIGRFYYIWKTDKCVGRDLISTITNAWMHKVKSCVDFTYTAAMNYNYSFMSQYCTCLIQHSAML